jgi:hypothetical protein
VLKLASFSYWETWEIPRLFLLLVSSCILPFTPLFPHDFCSARWSNFMPRALYATLLIYYSCAAQSIWIVLFIKRVRCWMQFFFLKLISTTIFSVYCCSCWNNGYHKDTNFSKWWSSVPFTPNQKLGGASQVEFGCSNFLWLGLSVFESNTCIPHTKNFRNIYILDL